MRLTVLFQWASEDLQRQKRQFSQFASPLQAGNAQQYDYYYTEKFEEYGIASYKKLLIRVSRSRIFQFCLSRDRKQLGSGLLGVTSGKASSRTANLFS